MKNAGLEEAQAEIKIAGRNLNNLRYADDTTLMAESEEEWKSLLMKVKEESEKVGLKLNIQKMKIMASSWWYHHFMGNRWGNNGNMTTQSCPILCGPMGYSPWNFPGQNTGVGTLSLLQGIFPTQGSNPGLPHCRHIIYQLSHKGSPRILEWAAYPFSRGSSWPRNWTRVSSTAGGFCFTNWAIREALKVFIYKKNFFGCLEYNHKHNNTSYNNVFWVKVTTVHSTQIMIFVTNLKLREKITQFQYYGYKYPMLPRYLHMWYVGVKRYHRVSASHSMKVL